MPNHLKTIWDWAYRYVLRFWAGKLGAVLLIIGFLLDSQSRIETFGKWLKLLTDPATAVILQSGWAHLAIVFIALILIFISTGEDKRTPLPRTGAQRLAANEASIQALQNRLENVKIEQSFAQLNQKVAILDETAKQSGPLYVWLNDIQTLINQADQAYELFDALRSRYPASEVAQHPFSGGWRPHTSIEPSDEPTRLGLDWAWRMKHHAETLQEFSRTHAAMFPDVSTGRLLVYITSWQSPDVTARECLELLKSHKNDLNAIRLAKPEQQRAKIEGAEPALPVRAASQHGVFSGQGDEFILSSPDDFCLKIVRFENEHANGLLATVYNTGLLTIARDTFRVLSARSFDARHSGYRDGTTYRPMAITQTERIPGSEAGAGMWLVRKAPGNSHLLVGNSEDSPLKWPSNDHSVGHRWLLHLDVGGTRIPNPPNGIPVALRPIDAEVIVLWDKEKNEFFVESVVK